MYGRSSTGRDPPAAKPPSRILPLKSSIRNHHRLAFVQEHADVTLRLGQRQGLLQRQEGSREISLCLVSQRLQDQDFDHVSHPAPFLRGLQ